MLLPDIVFQIFVQKLNCTFIIPRCNIVLHLGGYVIYRFANSIGFIALCQIADATFRGQRLRLNNRIKVFGYGLHSNSNFAGADPEHLVIRFTHIFCNSVQQFSGLCVKILTVTIHKQD